MSKFYSLFFLILLHHTLFAQYETRICGTTEYMQALAIAHPEMVQQRAAIEQHTQQFMQQQNPHTRSIVTIPVVVHVVYNLGSQNISDAQILSQIDVLNKDFRKQNLDFANTPGSFQPLAADCQIEFVLARRDPNGDSTNGITRTYTATTSFSSNNYVKSAATGGKDGWPPSQYLNIWVCKLAGGLLGYGQFPGGPEATDGVVISYRAFGTNGAAIAPFNKGRTATHEVGHWLNLFHISGDDGSGCNGTDLADDTPNQGAQNTGVPVYPHISCNNAPYGDMFMNYMDYTDDVAMTMFTLNQKTRMDALFSAGGARYTLLSSQGDEYPIAPIACGIPLNVQAGAIAVQSAQINWQAMPAATAYQFYYKKISDSVWNTLSPAGNSMQLNNLNPNTAYHCKVKTICGAGSSDFSTVLSFTTLPAIIVCGDLYESNNSMTSAMTISADSITRAMIGTVADNDYYRLEIGEQLRNVRITLSELPQDYDIYFYNIRGNLITTSQAGGLTNEEIIHNSSYNGPLTYHIRVKGYNGAYSNANCYKLNIETSATAFKPSMPEITEKKPEFILYPIPANDYFSTSLFYDGNQDVVCNLYNAMGTKVHSRQLVTEKGVNEVRFETAAFAPGVYLLEVIDAQERRVQTLQISR